MFNDIAMMPKVMLIIMDGWGLGTNKKADAIYNADTPFIDSLYAQYPNSTLLTFGRYVGLPEGQMGNSEVGHLSIGAGRIIYQELEKINNAIATHSLDDNPNLQKAIAYAKTRNRPFHLIGLVSDGGIHSHQNHLYYLLSILHKNDVKKVYVHAFTDGRDTDPKSGITFITSLQNELSKYGYELASVTGRYYAMDRDKRWERTEKAYNALVKGIGTPTESIIQTIAEQYRKHITDEFITPIIHTKQGQPLSTIQPDDAVLCFNFRTDRCRQITEVLTQRSQGAMHPLKLYYSTMTEYDANFKNVAVIFENNPIKNTLGEVLSNHNKKQLRVAETEKYPHITFFFNGNKEPPFPLEERLLIPSPKVATYDLQPEMSAELITEKTLVAMRRNTFDFICINFANTDMVGHTGVFSAAQKAATVVDNCVAKITACALTQNYTLLITADHGNADYMINENGTPNTSHTKNLVPLFLVKKEIKNTRLSNGTLCDLAPTILHILGIPIPQEMKGNILIR